MAYVFDLETDIGDILVDNLGTEIVEFALGYDLDAYLITLMSVTLVPTEDGICDLRFGIRERDAIKEWKVSGLDYTKEKVRECIPDDARAPVLGLLLEAIERLVQATRFNQITMETHYQDLSPKAMKKYQEIANILEINDFSEVDSFRSEDGTDYWLFSKIVEGA